MTKKQTSKKTPNSDAASFETSLSQLQHIVGDLEQGDIGLEESMQRFENGIALLRTCYRILEQAEQKIELLTGFDSNGQPETIAVDGAPTAEMESRQTRSPATQPDEEDQDNTLF
jgi:exodeoxyribonuclease VII small subunit